MRALALLLICSCSIENVELFRDGGGSGGSGGSGDAMADGPAAQCLPGGATCTINGDCCSAHCNSNRCADFCAAIGTPCGRAQDCCSLSCENGYCLASPPICTAQFQPCMHPGQTDSTCCSGFCNSQGYCQEPAGACYPAGEACQMVAGTPQCCSGPCPSSLRCDFAGGTCRTQGVVCSVDLDCCRGQCLPNMAGLKVCTSSCIADGLSCTTGTACCSGSCNGTCQAQSGCKPIAATCTLASECCSGLCVGGFCEQRVD